MATVADAAVRTLLLLALSLAPSVAPVAARGVHGAAAAVGWTALLVALYGAATFGVRRMAPRFPGAAALAGLALLEAPLASAWFSGDRGPLARGAWVMAPLVWAALAAIAAGPLADAGRLGGARRGRVVVGLVVLSLGVASFAVARGRVSSGEALWRRVQAVDPGDEDAAFAVAAVERAAHHGDAALAVLLACAAAAPDACPCPEAAAGDAIDLGRYPDARRVLDASDTCPRTPHRMGVEAESLVGTPGSLDEGAREADRVLSRAPDEPHALFARAWAAVLRGRRIDALPDAKRSVELGRGIPAELLYGLILFQDDDVAGADVQFARILAEDPTNVRAVYDHALVADRQQRYHDAREGYLRALSLDPSNADARYNLVVLTHDHGATLEASHDLAEFASHHAGDPRLPGLRQLVASPPKAR